MKSSLCALAFVLLCANHAFAVEFFPTAKCPVIKVLASGYLNSATATAELRLEAIDENRRERANELLKEQLQYLNVASSYSTISATFCKP